MAGLRRLGVFGGTFDPPHIGHLILAAEACQQLALTTVLWVLTPSPPHKRQQVVSPQATRLLMLQAAIADAPLFQISRVDMDRPPPHYAIDTVTILKAQYPDGEMVYLMGADSLRDLPRWHRPRDFAAACNLVGVMRRPETHISLKGLEAEIPGITQKVQFIPAPRIEISSSNIRMRVGSGRPFRYFVPEGVYQIIQEMRLYR